MIDVSTKYLGLKLNGPIVVSSTPLSESIDNVRRMEDAGAAAIVLTSLFEEQLALESRALDEDLSRGTESFAESLGYLPDLNDYRMSHQVYLDHIRRCKEAVNIPIIASLNGVTTGGWVRFAEESEQARADAIELNTFALATDRSQTSEEMESQLLELVTTVCGGVKIPVAVKLSQNFTSLPHIAAKLEDAGAAGVVLFNRFYQPDFEVKTHKSANVLELSHMTDPMELRLRLHILFGHLNIDIGITGGVHSAEDVIKSIMAGGNVAMMCSALHIHGIDHIGRVLSDLQYWLEKREFSGLSQTRGCLSRRSVPDVSPFDRGNYIKTLSSYSLRQTVAAF